MLEAVNITKRYSGITAVDNVSITVERGETLGIIGTNGAGKTTLFNILTGFERADSGQILCKERKVARTFQNLRLFYGMTVRDNLLVSTFACKQEIKFCDDLLCQTKLWDKRDSLCDSLPYGEMRILELVRAVATGAKLIFLDEPSAAMTQPEAFALDSLIKTLKQNYSLTVVMIEHNMELVRLGCDRVYAMAEGRIISTGTPDFVLGDPTVIKTMLA